MEKKIGKNVSSGAKKVEAISKPQTERAPQKASKKAQSAKRSNGQSAAKKSANATQKNNVEIKKTAEEVAAEHRLEKAKLRAEKKEHKLLQRAKRKEKQLEKRAALKEKKLAARAEKARKTAERKAQKENRRAELKAEAAERKAQKIARKELLKSESREEKRNRIAREKQDKIALKKTRREQAVREHERKAEARRAQKARNAEKRNQKRAERKERKKNNKGVGGWIAAVVSLGVACLALATVVTAGSMQMNTMTLRANNGYRTTLYEMVSVAEDMDAGLNKLRVSTGANEQHRLLTQLVVDTAILENELERLPIDAATSTDISAFLNRTNREARRMLHSLQTGGELNAEEKAALARLYEINTKVYNELNELAMHTSDGDLKAFIEGAEGSWTHKMKEIGQGMHEVQEEEGLPFMREGNVGKNYLTALEEVSEAQAETLAKSYFKDYHVREVRTAGETLAGGTSYYHLVVTEESGVTIDVGISKNGGKLAFFNRYEACTTKNFDLDTCDAIAREFLSGLGITDVEAVWLSDGGMVANLTYAATQNGVRMYPDLIRIRVCEEKGRVIGMDATSYLMNHHSRNLSAVKMNEEEAMRSLSSDLKPYEAHLAILPVYGEERIVYEFACAMGEEEYLVYVDAATGEELDVFIVRNSAQGRYLR